MHWAARVAALPEGESTPMRLPSPAWAMAMAAQMTIHNAGRAGVGALKARLATIDMIAVATARWAAAESAGMPRDAAVGTQIGRAHV